MTYDEVVRGLRDSRERWWATAEADEWLRQQWRRGWEPEAEDTVAEMGGKPWSGDALLERLEHRLPIAVR